MKLGTLTMAVAAACVLAQSAEARTYHHQHTYYRHEYRHYAHSHEYRHYAARRGYAWRYAAEEGSGYAGGAYDQGWSRQRSGYGLRRTAYRGGYGPRPAAWCGWYMRQLLGVSNPAFNLARNWARWGHSGAPGVGAVVVWPHHVGKIVGREGGQWVIQSGNDGHAVRTRPRSIAGAIAVRWG
jgi:hypothetical protein